MTLRGLASRPAAHFLVLAVLLLWPWRVAGHAYGAVVTAIATAWIGGADATPVRFRYDRTGEGASADNPWVLRVTGESVATGKFVTVSLDLRRSGYRACALFIALALATPIARRRRALLLALGLVPLSLLPLLPLLTFFSGPLPVRAFTFSAPVGWAITIAYRALVAAPGMAYALPALLWLALFRWLEPARFRQALAIGHGLAAVVDGHRPQRIRRGHPPVA